MSTHVAHDPVVQLRQSAARVDIDGTHHGNVVAALRERVEHLERITLAAAKEVEALADEVERLRIENEELRQPHGLRAAVARGWHRLDA